jgi:hypothetical protein
MYSNSSVSPSKTVATIVALSNGFVVFTSSCAEFRSIFRIRSRSIATSGTGSTHTVFLTTILVNNAYTFRSLQLTAIDAGH